MNILNFTDSQINHIVILQREFKKLLKIRNGIRLELNTLFDISSQIISRIHISYSQSILNSTEYKQFIENLSQCIEKLKTIPLNITLKDMNKLSKYKIMITIAEVKLKLINIIQKCGSTKVQDILKLILSINFNNSTQNIKYKNLIIFYNKFFNPTGCDVYESINSENISFTLYNYGDNNNSSNNIKLTSFQVDYPSCNKLSIFTKSLVQKLYGAKLYFPLDNKLLVIYGYFNKDDLNLSRHENFLDEKRSILIEMFENLDINDVFKSNYLEQISLRDFILFTKDDICNSCISAYNDFEKMKAKNIATLIKDFLINDIEKQRYYITILLLNSHNSNSYYLAHLLYDLLVSDTSLPTNLNHITMYQSLHWHVQKLFKISQKEIERTNDKLMNFNEDNISYEKRIHLMKAEDSVKSKAMDKLKEINNSKGGETNAKAQQYVDGLLKIPFGYYKRDCLNIDITDSYNKLKRNNINILTILNDIEQEESLSDNGLDFIDKLRSCIDNMNTGLKNPLSMSIFYNSVKSINYKQLSTTMVKLNTVNGLETYLQSHKNKALQNFCILLDIPSKGTKINIITRILGHSVQSDFFKTVFTNFTKYSEYTDINSLDKFKLILQKIDNNNTIWDSYKIKQGNYLDKVDSYLDNAVFGLKTAKNQIKRVIAQWINGENTGYVFGFEGPPGTGKTTLAKRGISQSLQDDNGTTRPFIFIALGGSANGSTLEGHNYTYVGSTWGRIVDSLIEAKCMNPIIYIDELDKISRTEHGKELVGILTHLTDPAQNEEFCDKYFSGIKFDISKCLIIFSYNDASQIDRILLDRIHRIQIDPLNRADKLVVAQKHLLPEIITNIGFSSDLIVFPEDVLIHIIDIYTYEAGARKLKERLYEIAREINLEFLKQNITLPVTITIEFVDKLFKDLDKITVKKINETPEIGLVNGLYATSAGLGGITVIEAYKNFSNNMFDLILTGQQGDVMKESMNVAKTLSWNLIPGELQKKFNDKDCDKFSIHIHCPATSTPKDGPSAGTAITVCILSLLTGFKIKNNYALTGEIDLNGNVTKIGGLEAKIDGAKLAGVTFVLCPKENEEDLIKIRERDMPPEDDNFKVEMIDTIYDAISHLMIFGNNQDVSYFSKLHI